jgi:hypothetical protein
MMEPRQLEKDVKYFLNKSIILYGPSKSGKSTVLMEMLYLLKEEVPLGFVFSLTADDNNAFEGIIPAPLIHSTVDMKLIHGIYRRQQAATRIYNMVNNPEALKCLFDKVASPDDVAKLEKAYLNARDIIERRSPEVDVVSFRESIYAVRDEFLNKLYKYVIRRNKARLLNMDLTDADRYTIKYLDFNPHCIIVLDDCGVYLKQFQKDETMLKILFQGRHNYISVILTLQDDVGVDSGLKKNAFISVFTTETVASAYFDRLSNNFSKKEKERARQLIQGTFSDIGTKNHRKLVYLRDDPDPIRYTWANKYGVFRFGCDALWEMCSRISSARKRDITKDPLLSAFAL